MFAGAEGHTKESQGMEKQPKRANATLVAGEPVAARSKGREVKLQLQERPELRASVVGRGKEGNGRAEAGAEAVDAQRARSSDGRRSSAGCRA